jgi:hypothetical protein
LWSQGSPTNGHLLVSLFGSLQDRRHVSVMKVDPEAAQLLAAADELRTKRNAHRAMLSKSQLRKARRRLGKLYAQASNVQGW